MGYQMRYRSASGLHSLNTERYWTMQSPTLKRCPGGRCQSNVNTGSRLVLKSDKCQLLRTTYQSQSRWTDKIIASRRNDIPPFGGTAVDANALRNMAY